MTRKERLQRWLDETTWVENLIPSDILGSGSDVNRTSGVRVEEREDAA